MHTKVKQSSALWFSVQFPNYRTWHALWHHHGSHFSSRKTCYYLFPAGGNQLSTGVSSTVVQSWSIGRWLDFFLLGAWWRSANELEGAEIRHQPIKILQWHWLLRNLLVNHIFRVQAMASLSWTSIFLAWSSYFIHVACQINRLELG